MLYTVIYRIETEADSARAAALEVEDTIKNGHYRPVFEITDKDGNMEEIDLEIGEEEEKDEIVRFGKT